MSKILTFEYGNEDGLEIHFNEEGLDGLIETLEFLRGKRDHVVLMTEDWGGEGVITTEKQGLDNNLFKKVKLLSWPSSS